MCLSSNDTIVTLLDNAVHEPPPFMAIFPSPPPPPLTMSPRPILPPPPPSPLRVLPPPPPVFIPPPPPPIFVPPPPPQLPAGNCQEASCNYAVIEEMVVAGLHLIRIDKRSKTPADSGWTTKPTRSVEAFLANDDSLRYNVGLATGGVSGGIVCVDLDGVSYETASEFLPITKMREGRKSRPNTHLYYRITDPEFPDDLLPKIGGQTRNAMENGTIGRFPGTKHFKVKSNVVGVKTPGIDVLMAGGQVVVPPSVHDSGEIREWSGGVRGEPAPISYKDLMACVERLAEHIGCVLKKPTEKQRPKEKLSPAKSKRPASTHAADVEEAEFPSEAASDADVQAARQTLKAHGPAIDGQGGSSHTYRACCIAGDFGLTREQATEELMLWNETCYPPWEESDLVRQLNNAYKSRQNPVGCAANDAADTGGDEDGEDHEMLGCDLDLAARFIKEYHNDVRFCPEVKSWMFWDGKRWKVDVGEIRVQEMAKQISKMLFIESADTQDRNLQKELWKAARYASSNKGVMATIKLAHSDPKVVVCARELDNPERCKYLLNALNGVIDLRTGEIRPHDRELLMTKLAGAEYHPDAEHPAVTKVLSTLTDGDPEILNTLKRVWGMSATGDTSAKVFVSVIGPADSGKGTSLEAHRSALGEYVRVAPVDLFVDSDSAGRATPEIAALKGVRLAYANETREGGKLDCDKLKRIVGGDEEITGRALYQDHITFPMEALLFLASNEKPYINDQDEAMWKRMVVFTPTASIPADQRDPNIKGALQRDPAAKAAWLAMVVKGAMAWWADGGGYKGLKVPERLDDIKEKYKEDVDPIRDFLSEKMVFGFEYRITRARMHEIYADWCRHHGTKPMSHRALTRRLLVVPGVTEGSVQGLLGWHGVGPVIHSFYP